MTTLTLSQPSGWNFPSIAGDSRTSGESSHHDGPPFTVNDYRVCHAITDVGGLVLNQIQHTAGDPTFQEAVPLEELRIPFNDGDHTRSALETSVYVSPTHSKSHDLYGIADTIPPDTEDLPEAEQSPSSSPPPAHQYHLRPTARNNISTTWVDKDDSGNYDPAQARKRPVLKRKKRTWTRAFHEDLTGHDNGDDLPKANNSHVSWLAARQRGGSLVVTLSLESDAGKALLATIPGHWPDDEYNILDDCHISSLLGHEGNSHCPHLLRARNESLSSREIASGSGLRDPAGIEDDLTGHPDARGCVACRRLRVRCPLLDDDTSWPCNHCIEDDCDCELITTPVKKRACEQCKRRRAPCSYSDGGDPDLPCQQCSMSNSRCVAGPAAGARRARISLDFDCSERPAPQYKRPTSCFPCRQANIQCSLTAAGGVAPCTSCVEDHLDCILKRQYKSRKGKEPVRDVEVEFEQQHEPTHETAYETTCKSAYEPIYGGAYDEGHENTYECAQKLEDKIRRADVSVAIDSYSTMIDIHTAFCHPIKFNYKPSARTGKPCHWCQSLAYGAFGLGSRDVTVLYNDGLQYTEIINGYAAENKDFSRMCVGCTQARTRICCCATHEMRRIEYDFAISQIEEAAAIERLIANRPLPTDRWCVVCPSLAQYECCTWQETEVRREKIGCGLQLCEKCGMALFTEFEGDLQLMVGSMMARKKVQKGKLRADAELLLEDGLLMRNVKAGRLGRRWE